MKSTINKRLEKVTDIILLLTAVMGVYLAYPGMASCFMGAETMNGYQILWNVCLCFTVFNVYLLLVILVFRLKKKLNAWLEKEQ